MKVKIFMLVVEIIIFLYMLILNFTKSKRSDNELVFNELVFEDALYLKDFTGTTGN